MMYHEQMANLRMWRQNMLKAVAMVYLEKSVRVPVIDTAWRLYLSLYGIEATVDNRIGIDS